MKLEQLIPILTAFVFSRLSSSLIQGKRNDAKIKHRHFYNDEPNTIGLIPSSFQTKFNGQPTPRKKETKLSVALDVRSAPSSLLRRDLKQTPSHFFFFEKCSDVCADTGGVATLLDDDCCEGGVSYLKVKFHAQDQITGTVALGSTHSPLCDHSQTQSIYKGAKASYASKAESPSKSFNYEHRLVDCNAACINNPFGGSICREDPVLYEKMVRPGSEICIAMVKSSTNETYEVTFEERMPTDINILFLSNKGFSVGSIHTSCSVPLSQSWGVRLEDPCVDFDYAIGRKAHSGDKHINVTNILPDSTPYLSFVDGISTKYFSAVDAVLRAPDALSYAQDFSIGFKDCGCTCDLHNATLSSTSSDIPSQNPSKASYSSSTPSKDPTTNPILFPSLPPSEDLSEFPTNSPSQSISFVPSVIPSQNPSKGSYSSTPLQDPATNPILVPSPPPSEDPSLFPTIPHSESIMTFPTTQPSSIPTGIFFSISSSPVPTYSPTYAMTSSSSASESSPGNRGPGAPSGSSCHSSCTAFILENCVFIGTNDACNMNIELPVVTDDDLEEGAQAGTLRPNAPSTGLIADDTGKMGKGTKEKGTKEKGTKGKERTGKMDHAKSGKKGKKWVSFDEKSSGKDGVGEANKRPVQTGTNLGKINKDKGLKSDKGASYKSDPGHERRLKEIKYHQTRLEHLKMLLQTIN